MNTLLKTSEESYKFYQSFGLKKEQKTNKRAILKSKAVRHMYQSRFMSDWSNVEEAKISILYEKGKT